MKRFRLAMAFGTAGKFRKGEWKGSKANWLLTAVPVIPLLLKRILIQALVLIWSYELLLPALIFQDKLKGCIP